MNHKALMLGARHNTEIRLKDNKFVSKYQTQYRNLSWAVRRITSARYNDEIDLVDRGLCVRATHNCRYFARRLAV
jgi:hypothetical protein